MKGVREAAMKEATMKLSLWVEVLEERSRQDNKWGEQNHPDGTGTSKHRTLASFHRGLADLADKEGFLTWRHILLEEVYEALAEDDPTALRKELIQVAAVALAWVEAIDRREKREGSEGGGGHDDV